MHFAELVFIPSLPFPFIDYKMREREKEDMLIQRVKKKGDLAGFVYHVNTQLSSQ